MSWNGSNRQENTPLRSKKSQKMSLRSILVIVSICLISTFVIKIYVVSLCEDKTIAISTSSPKKIIGSIKTKSVKTSTNTHLTEVKKKANESNTEIDKPAIKTNNIPEGSTSEIEDIISKVPSYERERIRTQLIKMKQEPARSGAEQLLLLTTVDQRGESMPPIPVPDDEFGASELQKSVDIILNKIGQIEEWDTDESILIKEKLELLKDEYYKQMIKGVSFSEYLKDRLLAIEEDKKIYHQAVDLDKENFNNSNLSDEEYLKSREKINKILSLQGFKEVPKNDAEYSKEEEELETQTN